MGSIDSMTLLGGSFALCFLVIMWKHPKALAGISLLSILFVRTASHLVGSGALDAIDDIFVVVLLARALQEILGSKTGPRPVPGLTYFSLFAVFGVLSSVVNGVPAATTLAGAFLAIKGMLFGFAVAQLDWNVNDLKRVVRWGSAAAGVIITSGILNAAAPSLWASVFSVNGGIIYRYGLPSISGIFIHPFDFAAAMSMFALGAIAYTRYFGSNAKVRLAIIVSCLATISSLRRKDVIGLFIGAIILSVQGRRWGTLLSVALITPVLAVIGYGAISAEVGAFAESYLTVESAEARTVLTLGAFTTALKYIPLGAGFGRYGSRTAAVDYSPIYSDLNFTSVYGLGRGVNGAFLTDTAWPAILGETGIAGTLSFVVGLILMMRFFILIRKEASSPALGWLGATGIAWMTLVLVQSTGAAVFTSPPMFPFIFGLLGLAVAVKAATETSEEHTAQRQRTTEDRT